MKSTHAYFEAVMVYDDDTIRRMFKTEYYTYEKLRLAGRYVLAIALVAAALIGGLAGFLCYNFHPAKVFMGDTGSLTIGGIIAVVAIIIHKELMLPILCFVFFIESVSVILQTQYAKMGNKRGQKWRVFKRAPIHDAFRIKPGQLPADFKILINWPQGCWLESKITTRFWIITIMLAALAIVTLKIR